MGKDGAYRKIFTLERANAALPLLGRIAGEMTLRCRRIRRLRDLYRALKEEVARGAAPDGAFGRIRAEYDCERQAYDGCVREVESLGGRVHHHEPLTLHFLGELESGRRLVLCWTSGERRFEHYHPEGREDGSRRPIRALIVQERAR